MYFYIKCQTKDKNQNEQEPVSEAPSDDANFGKNGSQLKNSSSTRNLIAADIPEEFPSEVEVGPEPVKNEKNGKKY